MHLILDDQNVFLLIKTQNSYLIPLDIITVSIIHDMEWKGMEIHSNRNPFPLYH